MASRRTALIIRQRRKRRQTRAGSASKVGRIIGGLLSISLFAILIISIGTAGTGVAVYATYARQLPPGDSMVAAQRDIFQTSILYDRTGQTSIYEVIDPLAGDRQYVTIDEVPEHFLQATVAIEDSTFYDNPGFDIRGIIRALWSNSTGGTFQGASTITQQLVKNVLIEPEERDDISLDRKFKEVILASELSRLYSKDQILEWYINTNFYGNLAYGIEAAARVYFDKPARDLNLAESAMLAAIPQFPLQNPIDNPEVAIQRQRIVLNAMVQEGFVAQAEANSAMMQPLVIKPFAQRFNITAPHFSLYARREAEAILNGMGLDGSRMISRDGMRIYTTLDLALQQQLECVTRSHVTRLAGTDPNFVHNTNAGTPCEAAEYLPSVPEIEQSRYVTNSAGVVLNARTGEIVAMLGSVDYWNEGIDGNFNTALGLRQPASTFKPFVYVTAFFNPIDLSTIVTPATMLTDVRTEFDNGNIEPYIPENIDRQYHGPVSVREALAKSYNIPAVQVLNWVGLSPVLTTAHSMGINSMNEGQSGYGLSLALGAAEASLLDMTYAYNVFNLNGSMVGSPVRSDQARAGYRQLNPVAILRIEDADGNILWEYSEARGTFDRRSVLEPAMAYMMTDILSDEEARLGAFPRNNPLELSRPAAAKTGTSDDFRDSWTIGYTPQYTTGIWVGNNDNLSMGDVTGMMGAAPIWHAIMEYVHIRDVSPIEIWNRPETVIEQMVCKWSGLLPTRNCPQVRELFYYNPSQNLDYRPYQQDTYWQAVNVNDCNNTLATAYSPPGCVAEKVYFDFPENMQAWAASTPGVELPPTTYDPSGSDSVFNTVVITSPTFLQNVSGVTPVLGNVVDDELDYFRLDVGAESNPDAWQQIGTNQSEGGRNIVLGNWATGNLPDGLYTLRLTLVRADATPEFAYREVIVDNTAPTVRLTSLEPGKRYSAERDVFIELVAETADNNQIDSVEFFLNGDSLNVVTAGPYTHLWEIQGDGEVTFWAVVIDNAGNRTESERITVQLTP